MNVTGPTDSSNIHFYLKVDRSKMSGKTCYTILSYKGEELSTWDKICKYLAENISIFSKTTYELDENRAMGSTIGLNPSTTELDAEEEDVLAKRYPQFRNYMYTRDLHLHPGNTGDDVGKDDL